MLVVAELEVEGPEAVGWVRWRWVSGDDSSWVRVPGGGEFVWVKCLSR